MPSVNLLILIFSLAVVGILVLSALFGFLAGLKREIRLTIEFIVLLVIVWLILGNVKGLLDWNFSLLVDPVRSAFGAPSSLSTVREVVVWFLRTELSDYKELFVEGTKTYAFVMNVLEFALRAVIVLIGTLVVYLLYLIIRLITYIITRIVLLSTIKRRRRKQAEKEAKRETELEDGVVVVQSDVFDGEVVVVVSRNPKKVVKGKRRWWAAFLGLLRGLAVVILLCVPITGLLSIVKEVEPETVDMVMDMMSDDSKTAADSESDLVNWVLDLANAYENSTVYKALNVPEYFLGKRLDSAMFDSLFKIETKTQTIYLREELITFIKVANILPECYYPEKSMPIDVWALPDARQDELIDLLKQIKLFAELMPVGVEVAETIPEVKELLNKADQTLDGLKNVDWRADMPLIFDAVRAALELDSPFGDTFDPLTLNSDILREVVSNIGSTTFIKELMPVAINCALYIGFVEEIVGPWDGTRIDTSKISWKTEFVNLVDIYEKFQTLDLDFENLDVMALLQDDDKVEVIESMLSLLVTHRLFLDVMVPIADVAKEFQMGKLEFEEFKGLLRLRNLEDVDWDSDVKTLIDMVKLADEIGVLAGEVDFYNYDAYRAMINDLFDLLLLSDKVKAISITTPEGKEVQLKTLIVEAAFRQFKLFDIEGKVIFERYDDYDRGAIDWEAERAVFLALVDEYESFNLFLESKGDSLTTVADKLIDYLDYEETYDHIIDIMDVLVDSNFAMATMPFAIEKFITPIINEFEAQAGYEDISEEDQIAYNITENVNSRNLAAEVFNVIYMLMDAYKIGLFSMIGENGELALGESVFIPENERLKEDYEHYAEVLGYRPQDDDLAITDIVERLFSSKILEGREGKVIRIALAISVDLRLAKDAIYNVNYNDSVGRGRREVERSERQILVDAINGLKPILTDPEFKLFNEDNSFNVDYFLTTENVTTILNSLITLFDSNLIAVILPEYYNQKLIPQGTIPEEWAEIFTVESLWLDINHDGLTGEQLCEDVQTLLKMLQLVVDFNVVNAFDETKDFEFAGGKEVVNKFFDLMLTLNVVKDRGDKIASLLAKQLFDADIAPEEFDEAGVNWRDEVNHLKNVLGSIFDLLEHSEIETYRELREILDNPMDNLERFLVDENVGDLGNILKEAGQSNVLALVANPIFNKYVAPMLEGLGELSEEEYSGKAIAEDIVNLGDILTAISEARLMDTIKAVLAKYTDLLEDQGEDIKIPLPHEQYATILKELMGLNILQSNQVKQYGLDKLQEMLGEDYDLSDVDVSNLDLKGDGEILAAAYLRFVDEFHQEVVKGLTVDKLLDLFTGEDMLNNIVGMITEENLYALGHFASAALTTTIANELGLVLYKIGRSFVPEDLQFLLPEEMTKEEIIEDITSIKEIIQDIIEFGLPAINEILENWDEISEDFSKILELELKIDPENLGPLVEDVLTRIAELNIFEGRGDEIITGLANYFGIELYEDELADIVWHDEIAKAAEAAKLIGDVIERTGFQSVKEIMDFIQDENFLDNLLSDADILTNENVIDLLEAAQIILSSDALKTLAPLIYDEYLAETVEGLMDGKLADVLSFDDDFTVVDLIEDISDILEVAQKAVELGALDLALGGGELHVGDYETVGEILELLGGLNILNERLEEIAELAVDLAGVDIDLSGVNWDNIDLPADAEKLAEAYKTFVEEFNQDVFHTSAEDIQAIINGEKPISELLGIITEENIDAVLNLLDAIIDTTVVQELSLPIYQYAREELVPEELQFLLPEEMTGEEIAEDLASILHVVEEILDFAGPAIGEILDNLDGIMDGSVAITDLELQFNPENLGDLIEDVLTTIAELNIFEGRGDEVVTGIANLMGIEVYEDELADVVWHDEIAKITEAMGLIGDVIERTGFTSVGQIMEFIQDEDFIDNLLSDADIITSENVYDLLEAVQILLSSDALHALAPALYDEYLAETVESLMDGKVAEMLAFDEEFGPADLLDDASILLEIIQKCIELGAIEFAFNGGELHVGDYETVGEIFELAAQLNILNERLDKIAEFGLDMAGLDLSLESVNWDAIDLAADAELMAEAYKTFVENFNQTAVKIDMETIGGLMDGSTEIAEVLQALSKENVLAILDFVEAAVSTSLVRELDIVGYEFAQDKVTGISEKLSYLVPDMTAEQVNEDLLALFDIVENLIGLSGNAIDVVIENIQGIMDGSVNIMDLPIEFDTENMKEYLHNILADIDGLNLIDGRGDEVILKTLEIFRVKTDKIDLDRLDIHEENAIIYAIVDEIAEMVIDLGIYSLEDVNNLLENIGENETLADTIDAVLPHVVEILKLLGQSGYVEELTIPIYNTALKKTLSKLLAQAGIDLGCDFDFYTKEENTGLLIEDVSKVARAVELLSETNLVDFILRGKELDLEALRNVGEAVEVLFSLAVIEEKQEKIIKVLNEQFGEEYALTDASLDLPGDGVVLHEIIDKVIDLLEGDLIEITTLDSIGDAIANINLDALTVQDQDGNYVYIDDIFEILHLVGELSFLDEGVSVAKIYAEKSGLVPEELSFLLDLGEAGAPGIVEDYNSIVDLLERIADTGIIQDAIETGDVYLLVGDVIEDVFDTLFGLNYVQGKGDKLIEYVADKYEYEELKQYLPVDWEAEKEAIVGVFLDIEQILMNCGFEYLSDILNFEGSIEDVLTEENLALVEDILDKIENSVFVQAALAAAIMIGVPMVRENLDAPYDELLNLDNLTVADLIDDVKSLLVIIRDMIAMNLPRAIGAGDAIFYGAEGVGDTGKIAGAEIFQLLFGLNYLNDRLGAIVNVAAEIIGNMGIELNEIDVEFLQSLVEGEDYTYFAEDGIKLGDMYIGLCDLLLLEIWPYQTGDDYKNHQLYLDEVYTPAYFEAINLIVSTLFDLNTVEAVIPVAKAFAKSTFEKTKIANIIDYICETPNALLQEDVLSLWNAIYSFLDAYRFDYYEETKDFINYGYDFTKLNLNLDMIDQLPELVDAIWNLNLLEQIKGDRFEEVATTVLDLFFKNYDKSDINWDDFKLIFDDFIQFSMPSGRREIVRKEDGSIQRATAIAYYLVNIIHTTGLDELSDIWNLMEDVNLDTILDLVNQVTILTALDMVDLFVNSKLVSGMFISLYNNILGNQVQKSTKVEDYLKNLLNMNPGYGYDSVYEIQADVTTLIDAIRDLVYFGIYDIYHNEAEINYAEPELVASAIEKLFSIKFLQQDGKIAYLVELAQDKVSGFDLSSVEASNLDLAGDGVLLGQALSILMKDLATNEAFPIKKYSDLEGLEIDSEALMDAYIQYDLLLSVVDALELISQMTIVRELVLPGYLYAKENFNEGPASIAFVNEVTKEQILEDFDAIIVIAREVVESEIFYVAFNDDFPLRGIGEHINVILDKVLHLNILNVDMAKVITKAMDEFLELEVDYEALSDIDYEADYQRIYQAINDLDEIIYNSKIYTFYELIDLYNGVESPLELLEDKFIATDANAHLAVDMVSNLINLQTIPVLFEPLYNKFVYESFKDGDMEKLVALGDYTGEMFVEDMNSLLEAVDGLIDFNIVGILRNDDDIEWSNTEPVANLIEAVFGMNLLDCKLEDIIDYVSEQGLLPEGFDLSILDTEAIDLAADGVLIANAYRLVAGEVLAIEALPFDSIGKIMNLETVDLGPMMYQEPLHAIVDAVECIVDTTIVRQALPVAYDAASSLLPEALLFIVDPVLTDEELQEDVKAVLHIAHELIDTQAYNMLIGDDFPVEGIAAHINEVLDTVLHMNLISADYASLIKNALFSFADVIVDYDELASVDYEHDWQNIYNIISKVERILLNAELDSYFDIVDFLADGLDVNALINDPKITSDANAHAVLDILSEVVNLELVSVLFKPLYNEFVPEMLEGLEDFEGFYNLDDYETSMLIEDLNNIIDALHGVVDWGVLGVVLDGEPIDWENTEPIDELIKTIFALNFLEVKVDNILDYVDENFINVSGVVQENINLAADGEVVAQMYDIIAFTVDKIIGLETIEDIMNAFEGDLSQYITTGVALEAVEVLDLVDELSFFKEVLYVVVSEVLPSLVPEEYEFLGELGPNDIDGLASDYGIIVEIARIAAATDIVDFLFHGENMSLELEDEAKQVIGLVFDLDYLALGTEDNKINKFLNQILDSADINDIDTNEIDWVAEEETFKKIIHEVANLLAVNEITDTITLGEYLDDITVGGKVKIAELITEDNVLGALNIVDIILDSTIAIAAVPYGVNMGREALQDSGFEFVLEDITVTEVIDALKTVVVVARDVVADGVLPTVVDAIRDYANTDVLPIARALDDDIQVLLSVELLKKHKDEFIDYLVELLGVDDSNINRQNIEWVDEMGLIEQVYGKLVDVLEANEINTYNTIMSIIEANEFLTDSRINNDANITKVVEIVKILTDSNLIAEFAIPAYIKYVYPMVDEIPYETPYQIANINYETYSVEKFKEDFAIIADLLAILDSQSALGVAMDVINNVEACVVMPDPFESIIRELYKTNLVQDRIDLIIELVCELLQIESSDINKEAIDSDYDVNVIVDIVRGACDLLLANDIKTIDQIVNLPDTYKDLLTKENGLIALDIVDRALDLTLLYAIAIPALDKHVAPLLTGDYEALADIYNNHNYTIDDLFADAHAVVSIAKSAIEFDALNIYFNDAEINWTNTEPIENVIEKVFALRILNNNKQLLLDFANDMVEGIDLSEINIDAIDLVADGALIAEAYGIIARDILATALNPYHYFKDFTEVENFYYQELLNKETLNSAVDAVDVIVDTTIVNEVVHFFYNVWAKDNLSDDVYFLVAAELTDKQLIEDVHTILSIVRDAIELEAYNILTEDEDIYFEGKAEVINSILDKLFHTNIVSDDYARMLVGALGLAGVEVAYEDAAQINYEHEFGVIYELVEEVIATLVDADLATYGAITDYLAEVSSIDDVLDDEQVANKTTLHHVINLVDIALDFETIDVAYVPLYNQFVAEIKDGMDASMQPLLSIDNYDVEAFKEDMNNLIPVLHEVVGFGVYEIYREGAEIEWANTLAVEELIKWAFASNYLDAKIESVLQIAEDATGIKFSDIDAEELDLAGDGELIASAYVVLATTITQSEYFPIRYFEDISLLEEIYYDDYLNEVDLNHALDALDLVAQTTLVKETLVVLYEYAKDILSEDVYFLVGAELTKEQLDEDLRTILSAARDLVAMEAYNALVPSRDINLEGKAESINSALDKILHTNIVSDDYARYLVGSLALAGIEVSYEDAQTINYEHEFGVIYNLVDELVATLVDADLATYKTIKDYISEHSSLDSILDDEQVANKTTLHHVINLVDIALDFETINIAYVPAYNKFVASVYENASEDIKPLLSIEDYEVEAFKEDMHGLLAVLHEVVDFGAYEIYRQGAEIEWANTLAIEELIKWAFASNYLDAKIEAVLQLAENATGIKFSEIDPENLDLAGDGQLFANAYNVFANTIAQDEYFPFHVYEDFTNVEAFYYDDYLNNQDLNALLDVVDEIVDTTLVKETLVILYEFAKDSLSDDVYFLVGAELTKEQLAEDLRTILDVARDLVELEAYKVLTENEDVYFEGKAEVINSMLDKLLHTNIVSADYAAYLVGSLALIGVEVAYEDAQTINYEHEFEVIYRLVEEAIATLVDADLATYGAITDYISEHSSLDSVLDDEQVANKTTLHHVINLVDIALDFETINIAYVPLYNKFVADAYENASEEIKPLLSIDDYDVAMFKEDMHNLVPALHELVDFGAYEIYRQGAEIEWENTATGEELIKWAFASNYVEVKLDALFDLAESKTGIKFTEVDKSALDLAADGEVFAAAYAVVASTIAPREYFPFHVYEDFTNIEAFYYDDYLNAEDLYNAIEALNILGESTLVQELLCVLYYNNLRDSLSDELSYISAAELTKEQLVEDYYSILMALSEAVGMEAYRFFLEENNIYFDGNGEAITMIVDILLHTNMVADDYTRFLKSSLELAGIEIEYDDYSDIDYEPEVQVVVGVVGELIRLLLESDIMSYQDLLDVIDYAQFAFDDFKEDRQYVNRNNAYIVLDILEMLGDSEVYIRTLLPVYYSYEEKVPEIFTAYIDMDQYTTDDVRFDYPLLIQSARLVLDSEIYRAYKEKRDYFFEEEAIAALEQIVANVAVMKFVNKFTSGIIRIAGEQVAIIDFTDAIDTISPEADQANLVALVAPLAHLWNNTEGLYLELRYFADAEVGQNIHDALAALEGSTLVSGLFPWAYNKYVAPHVETINKAPSYIDFAPLAELSDEQIVGLYSDIVKGLEDLIAINFFGSEALDFSDTQYVEDMVNIALQYVVVRESIENRLHMYARRSDLMDSFQIPWAEVTSTEEEIKALKNVVLEGLDLVDYLDALKDLDFEALKGDFKYEVEELLDAMEESVLISNCFIPGVNGLAHVVLGPEYVEYQPIPMEDFASFRSALEETKEIGRLARDLGLLDKAPTYKNTDGFAKLVHAIETNPFVAGQETYIVKIAEKVIRRIKPTVDLTDVDLSHIVWEDEYQMVYRFLDAAHDPLNMEGVEISADNIDTLLGNTEFVIGITDALRELAESQVLVAYFKDMFDLLGRKYETINEIIDYSHLDESDYEVYAGIVAEEYLAILDILALASELGFVGESVEVINVDKLLELFDLAFGLEGVRNTKTPLFNKYSDKLPSISSQPVVVPADIDWEAEEEAIREMIVALGEFADGEGNIVLDEVSELVDSSTNVAGLEALLTALNHSQIYRTQMLHAIDESIDGLTTTDLVVSEFLTEWFTEQVENGMLPVEDWEEEVIYIARILAIVNNMKETTGLDEVKTMSIGVMDDNDAAVLPTEELEIVNYGLRQLLQVMYVTKSFTLTAMNNVITRSVVDQSTDGSGKGVIKSQKALAQLSEDEWRDDVDNLMKLILDARSLGLLDTNASMADTIIGLSAAEVEAIVKDINHCACLRDLLPDMISDAVVAANASNYKSSWLEAQVGLDELGNNKPIASVEVWDEEAEAIGLVIYYSNDFEFDNLDVATLTDEELDTIEALLVSMNATKSFIVDYLTSIISDFLEQNEYETTPNEVVDANANGSNKDEWANEIPQLIDIIKDVNALGAIEDDTLQDQPTELGTLLEAMKVTTSLGGEAFDDLMINLLTKSGLVKDATHPDGFIEEADAQTADWTSYNYIIECEALSAYDKSLPYDEQTDDTIKSLQHSQIVRDYFDVATVINNKIAGKSMTIGGQTIVLSDYIQATNADMATRDWADELDDTNILVDSMDNEADFRAAINDLANSGRTTKAAEASAQIKADYGL